MDLSCLIFVQVCQRNLRIYSRHDTIILPSFVARLRNPWFLHLTIRTDRGADKTNSGVELNVAIIVSSAPAFSSFARTKLLQMPAVKSLLSSFSSGSKALDSEANAGSGPANDRPVNRSDEDTPPQIRSHRYYEMNDTWMLKSVATVDEEGMQRTPVGGRVADNGIMRTVAFGQAVTKTSPSTESLMESKH